MAIRLSRDDRGTTPRRVSTIAVFALIAACRGRDPRPDDPAGSDTQGDRPAPRSTTGPAEDPLADLECVQQTFAVLELAVHAIRFGARTGSPMWKWPTWIDPTATDATARQLEMHARSLPDQLASAAARYSAGVRQQLPRMRGAIEDAGTPSGSDDRAGEEIAAAADHLAPLAETLRRELQPRQGTGASSTTMLTRACVTDVLPVIARLSPPSSPPVEMSPALPAPETGATPAELHAASLACLDAVRTVVAQHLPDATNHGLESATLWSLAIARDLVTETQRRTRRRGWYLSAVPNYAQAATYLVVRTGRACGTR
jgi:hypothetical protein